MLIGLNVMAPLILTQAFAKGMAEKKVPDADTACEYALT